MTEPRIAKNALVESNGTKNRLYIDGVEFPYHVTAIDIDTVQPDFNEPDHWPSITITIPLDQGARMVFDSDQYLNDHSIVESMKPAADE